MQIGEKVYTRVDGQLEECKVIGIGFEDLKLEKPNGEIIIKKYWEIAKIRN